MTYEEIYKNNTKLVHYIINKKFTGFLNLPGVEYEDLLQEGNLALWKAIPMFDENKKTKPVTYYSAAIYNQILLYIMTKATIIKFDRNDDENSKLKRQLSLSNILYLDAKLDINDNNQNKSINIEIPVYDKEIEELETNEFYLNCIRKSIILFGKPKVNMFKHATARKIIIIEDYVYNIFYGEYKYKKRQLSKKYNLTQSYINRILKQWKFYLKQVIKEEKEKL